MKRRSNDRSALSILATRNFGSYFVGNLSSALGTWVQNIAQAILIFRITGSTLAVALVNFSQFAAVLVLAPWAGSAADRFDRKGLMIGAQILAGASAAVLAASVVLDVVNAALIVAVAAVIGLGYAITVPALQAIIPDLVDEADLPQAISLNAVTFNLARAVGPLLGAAIVTGLGFGWAFGLNAGSFLLFAAMLALTRPRRYAASPSKEQARFRDGARVLIERRELGLLMLAVSAVSIASDPVNTLTPGLAVDVYGRADTFTGVLVGVFGAGAVAAALVPRLRPNAWLAPALAAAGMVVVASTPFVWVGLIGFAIAGFGFLSSVTEATTRIQLALEADVRGRVMAVWSVAFLGVRPVASILDGFLAETVGLRAAAAAMAIPAFVVAVMLWRSPESGRG